MTRRAAFSGENDRYRDELRRCWDASLPMLVVCMLNPSTADHEKEDPTLLILIHFGKLWGFGGLIVVNLYSLRASRPSAMMAAESPIGPNNAAYLNEAIAYAEEHGGWLLAAWGNDGGWEGRDEWFCARAMQAGVTLKCLGTTNSGKPKHPMARGKHRIPRDQRPVVWRNAAVVSP